MSIQLLQLHAFRNLSSVRLDLSPGFNVFYGENASGKTSLLESVYLLNTGKSFRSKQPLEMIQQGKTHFALSQLYTLEKQHRLGYQRSLNSDSTIRLDGETLNSFLQIPNRIPIQLMTPHGFHLLETGPEDKRQYIDWGVFHVEHRFIDLLRRFKKALKHRNALLKNSRAETLEFELWENELGEAAEPITAMRQQYCESLFPVIKLIVKELLEINNIELQFIPGWDYHNRYHEILAQQRKRDQILGYTQMGPHKANLQITVNAKPIAEVFSRGQQKMFVCALSIAQGMLLKNQVNLDSTYLVDDIISELDQHNRDSALSLLATLDMQVLATCVDRSSLDNIKLPFELFHVEHGVVEPVNIVTA